MSLPQGLVQKEVNIGRMRVQHLRRGNWIDVYEPDQGMDYPLSVHIDLPPRPLGNQAFYVSGTAIMGLALRRINLVQRHGVYETTMQVLP